MNRAVAISALLWADAVALCCALGYAIDDARYVPAVLYGVFAIGSAAAGRWLAR